MKTELLEIQNILKNLKIKCSFDPSDIEENSSDKIIIEKDMFKVNLECYGKISNVNDNDDFHLLYLSRLAIEIIELNGDIDRVHFNSENDIKIKNNRKVSLSRIEKFINNNCSFINNKLKIEITPEFLTREILVLLNMLVLKYD